FLYDTRSNIDKKV
ncbi:exonuclease family protein, partial [Chlamydia psittaci 84-8471/1]